MPQTIILHLPVVRGTLCYLPTDPALRFNDGADQGGMALVAGLEADGAKLADGSLVKGLAGAIQYVLQQIHLATIEQNPEP